MRRTEAGEGRAGGCGGALRRRHRRQRRAASSLIIGAVLAGAGGAARAQETGSGPAVLAPLEVEGTAERGTGPAQGYVAQRSTTGSKTDTPLIENPQSVSVVSRARMDDQGVRSVGDALRYTAGVQAQPFGFDSRLDYFFLRGFDASQYGLYRDNLRLRSTGFLSFSVEPYGLERVEVVRGPSSVLYGQIAPGGLVNLVSKEAPQEPLREIGAAYGSHARKELTLDVGGRLDGEGRVAARFTGLGRLSDTQVDHVDDDRLYLAPTVTLRPRDGTQLTLLASHQRDDTGWSNNFLPAQGTFRHNPNGDIDTDFFTSEPDYDKYDRKQTAVGYRFEQEAGRNLTFRQNARYDRLELNYKNAYGLGLGPDLRTLNRGTLTGDDDADAYALDSQAQLKNKFGPLESTLLAGVDATRTVYDQRRGSGTAPSIDAFNPDYGAEIPEAPIIQDDETRLDQVGLYLQEQAKLWDRVVLTLGGRYDWTYTSIDNNLSGLKTQQDDEDSTWRAGIAYLFDNGLTPYASYSTSFNPTPGTDINSDPFQPDRGRQYEVGLKYQPPETDAFLTVAAFDLKRENVLTQDPGNIANQIQTGEVEVRGVEVEAVANPLPGLSLVASYTYLDAEIQRSENGDEGNRPYAVPSHLASAWADYKLQSGPLRGLGAGVGLRYIGNQEVDNLNTDQVPDRLLLDAALHYDIGGARLALNATNLLDDTYVASCANSPSFCYYGERRTIVGSVRLRW